MEIFEPGLRCPWTSHTFNVNDHGRKCLLCGRVIKLSAWQEKGRCFCNNTSLVEAVARASTPTRITRVTRINRIPQIDRPSSLQSPTSAPTVVPVSVTAPSYTSHTSIYDSSVGCFPIGCGLLIFAICASPFIVVFGLFLSMLSHSGEFKKTPVHIQSNTNSNNISAWNFPSSKCGDSNPPGLQDFYPVFVNRTDDSTRLYIQNKYCRDADLMTRESVNRRTIQVQ